MTRAEIIAAELLEKDWDAQLFASRSGLAPRLGWRSYHTLRSKGSAPGFPDRVLVRDRLIYAELKTGAGRLTAKQRDWLDLITYAGGEVYVWRPDDLEEIGRVLSQSYTFIAARAVGQDRTPPYLVVPGGNWTPGSMWINGKGRRDESR
jgi:hypothetical protein